MESFVIWWSWRKNAWIEYTLTHNFLLKIDRRLLAIKIDDYRYFVATTRYSNLTEMDKLYHVSHLFYGAVATMKPGTYSATILRLNLWKQTLDFSSPMSWLYHVADDIRMRRPNAKRRTPLAAHCMLGCRSFQALHSQHERQGSIFIMEKSMWKVMQLYIDMEEGFPGIIRSSM